MPSTPMLLPLLLLLALSVRAHDVRSAPQLPHQFQAQVEVLSHLTDPLQDYPPAVGRMKVHYDFDQQLARAEMLEGYDAGKTFVRRYDQVEIALTRLECAKQEFMVKHGEYRKCERAYLGDAMPQPEIPFAQEFVLGPQNVSSFDIPDGYEHSDCLRSAGGFPYIHAFHYYLRF
ncbi:hypothetical protein BBJ28_00001916 [Nothophytophthora sp. Chile5]|nr:hypothetical protein BBJ28_00001916 [Nothophytophthora sp. Chile5]